jgi:His-Xaa-Ser system radical SAM maturase HxsB
MKPRFSSVPAGLPPRGAPLAGLDQSGHFRFRKVGDLIVITNDTGDYELLTEVEFGDLLHGTLAPTSPTRATLRDKGFLEGGRGAEETAARLAQRKEFLTVGPYLHVLIVSLRCNQACVYCHASRRSMTAVEHDMSPETARRAVEVALQSPSPAVTLEFQGGEPLANFPVVKQIVREAVELNRTARKTLGFSLVSNLSLMDEEKLEFLLEHGVQVCTSLDGPQDLHDANRPFGQQSSHAETVRWMERINQGYVDRGLDPSLYHVEALLTVTRQSLARGRDIVDEYVRRGLKAVFVRPLNPFGFAQKTAARVGYTTAEYLDFYRGVLDHIIDLNRNGTEMLERLATIFLYKILTGGDPNYLDIRSPCGAGIGQMAYNFDGQVFCCDEGRMMHQMGHSLFRLGHLDQDGYGDLVESEVVRSVGVASCLEALPGCSECAYMPYCGSCPVFNYATQGNIFGRMPDNEKCRLHMGVMDRLFEILATDPKAKDEIFARWVETRERPFFVHGI